MTEWERETDFLLAPMNLYPLMLHFQKLPFWKFKQLAVIAIFWFIPPPYLPFSSSFTSSFWLDHSNRLMNVKGLAGSYTLLLRFPLMTFQSNLVGQCVELMMHIYMIHTHMGHAQTCSHSQTHGNTRWRWSGAACRLPKALSKSSPQGKRRDLQCLQWELEIRRHTHTHSTNTLFIGGAHLNLCNI